MPSPDRLVLSAVSVEWMDCVDSTNEEGLRRATRPGGHGPIWIAARQQMGGRGRNGRQWVSPPGNLYASLLLTFPRPLPSVAQLSLVAGLAAYDAVERLAPGRIFTLKWPNDLLLEGAKLGGILIEGRVGVQSTGHCVVIGIGLNLAHHPEIAGRQITSLAALNASATPDQALAHLSTAFCSWLNVWQEGAGLADICKAWMARALPAGTPVTVNTGPEQLQGQFLGLDLDGAMLLGLANGQHRRITFGDVDIAAPDGADR